MDKVQDLSDVSLIIATYNEEESIDYVLNELQQYNLGEIIIVDGKSSDKTKEISENYDITFLNQEGPAWGSAVKQGFRYASCSYVAYMDGDGSYNPASLSKMRELINQTDAVLGSRYKGGAKSPDDTLIRAFGNKVFTYIVRKLFGTKITDALFFFPMIKKELLKEINLETEDFTLCLELPVKLHKQSYSYIEILSEERERYAGITKVNAFYDGLKILMGILKLKRVL